MKHTFRDKQEIVEETADIEKPQEESKELEQTHPKRVSDGYVNNAGLVNFRSTPEVLDNNIIGVLHKDTKLTVIESVDGWAKVSIGGRTGYVMDQYITVR